MSLGDYPIKRVGSQGQQKDFLAGAQTRASTFLSNTQVLNQQPILLLDDIFDKLDNQRVERIIQLVNGPDFGQIFITDTDRQHLTQLLEDAPHEPQIFHVHNGEIYKNKTFSTFICIIQKML